MSDTPRSHGSPPFPPPARPPGNGGDRPTGPDAVAPRPGREDATTAGSGAPVSASDPGSVPALSETAAGRGSAAPHQSHAPSHPQPELPERFGRYRVLRKLGGGGMGDVYLAHDDPLDRLVALKVPRLRPGEEQRDRERFRREARAAAALRHPNICPVFDVGEAGGVPYLTMAYIEGQPLSRRLAEYSALPPARVA